MKCSFCKQYVNEKRRTTYYTFVPRKNGTMKKVRWCKQCDESKADQIDQFLREQSLKKADKLADANPVALGDLMFV